jgi:hypothetical protein
MKICTVEDFEKPSKTSNKYPKIYKGWKRNGSKSKSSVLYVQGKRARVVDGNTMNMRGDFIFYVEHANGCNWQELILGIFSTAEQ